MVPLGTVPAPARTSPEPRGALGTEVLAGQEGQDRLAVLLPAPAGPQGCQGGGAMPADPWDDEQLLGAVCNPHSRCALAEPLAALCHHTVGTPGGLSWFNPSRQLSTTQPLAHCPPTPGMGERIRKKTRELR